MIRKIGFYFLSLWLLFILIIIITINLDFYNGNNIFIGIWGILYNNIIPLVCLLFIIIGICSYCDFRFHIKGTPELSFNIIEIKNIDYEHLTFLTTYIVPLVCFELSEPRYVIVLAIILFVIGIIYIKTDLFYANPTLAILQFRIYKVSGDFRNNEFRNDIVLITRDKLIEKDNVEYIKIDKHIYYAYKSVSNGKK